ncbi:MAG: hypothetical protein IPI83_11875 [Sphingomonadales bacterium]|nr:hypothetical protein [Sphingomonadales bacterium]
MLRKLVFIIAGMALLAGLGWRFVTHWGRAEPLSRHRGIDVSQEQGVIDWKAAVPRASILPISGPARAVTCATNACRQLAGSRSCWRQTRRLSCFQPLGGRGASKRRTLSPQPREEAALPHALDLEFEGNCAARPPRQSLIAEIATFIEMAEAHSEKPMILYMTREFEDQYRVIEAIDRPLWLRRAGLEPGYGDGPG